MYLTDLLSSASSAQAPKPKSAAPNKNSRCFSRDKAFMEERRRRLGVTDRMAPLSRFRETWRIRRESQERRRRSGRGELRSRGYEEDGINHRVFECRVESILKLDRAVRGEASDSGDALEL